MVDALSPGQAWLSKLLPVFFVPGLAMLPVAPSVGSLVEVLKYLSIIIVGFFYSLGITVYSVEFVDSLLNGNKQKRPTAANSSTTIKSPAAVLSAASKPAFMAETLKALITCAVVSGAISVAATNAKHQYANPIQSLFLAFATVGGFVFGSRLPSSFTKIVHPLVTSTFVSWGTIQLLALLIGTSFADILGTFKSGSMELFKIGAGDALLFMLGASVVSLAVPMYGRRKLVKDNLPVVLTAMLVSSVGGLFGTAFYIRLIQVSSETVRISVLPRFVTTPLAIAILNILEGGSIPIGAAAVVLTGIFCGTFGRSILDSLGIKSPIARGLAIGASGQGLGVASLVSEKDAFPFGAVSMVMTAVGATTLVSIPAVKKLLLQIALK
jgi:putative effector of murein hydrolase